MFPYDLFLSYSSRDTNEAQAVEGAASNAGLRVFLAKRDLAPGDQWEERIRIALLQSREVGVLMTTDSLSSHWVTSEWASAWLLQRIATPILKDVTVSQLPERLRSSQTADYYKLNQYLDAVKSRKSADPLTDEVGGPYETFARASSILPTLFAPTTGTSPFVFKDLLGLAQHRVFLAGQNLYTLLVRLETDTKNILFEFLGRENRPNVSLLLCDPQYKPGVETWTWVCGSNYEGDLLESVRNLQSWNALAANDNLQLDAKLAPFIPVSMTFVDPVPRHPRAKLFLTPNVFEPSSSVRTCFFLYGKFHEDTVTKYWENYELEFKRAKSVLDTDPNYISTRLRELGR